MTRRSMRDTLGRLSSFSTQVPERAKSGFDIRFDTVEFHLEHETVVSRDASEGGSDGGIVIGHGLGLSRVCFEIELASLDEVARIDIEESKPLVATDQQRVVELTERGVARVQGPLRGDRSAAPNRRGSVYQRPGKYRGTAKPESLTALQQLACHALESFVSLALRDR